MSSADEETGTNDENDINAAVTEVDEVVVVVTGSAALDPRVIATLPDRKIVLAADGAIDHALAVDLPVAGLVGDLDSVSEAGLAWAEEHATIERHEPNKDHTDTELALALAAELQPDRLIVISGGGDRLDHTFAAIGALGHPGLTSIPIIEVWWGLEHLQILHGPARATIDVETGATISLLAMHGPCEGVNINNVMWPLENAELAPMTGHGVSNVTTDSTIELSVSSGVLSVFLGSWA